MTWKVILQNPYQSRYLERIDCRLHSVEQMSEDIAKINMKMTMNIKTLCSPYNQWSTERNKITRTLYRLGKSYADRIYLYRRKCKPMCSGSNSVPNTHWTRTLSRSQEELTALSGKDSENKLIKIEE